MCTVLRWSSRSAFYTIKPNDSVTHGIPALSVINNWDSGLSSVLSKDIPGQLVQMIRTEHTANYSHGSWSLAQWLQQWRVGDVATIIYSVNYFDKRDLA
jgi:hypothetical protein